MAISLFLYGKKFTKMLEIIFVIVNGHQYLPGFLHPGDMLIETISSHYIWLPTRIKVPQSLGYHQSDIE